MKKDPAIIELFFKLLRQIPNIGVAAKKIDVARSTVYLWRDTDPEFRKNMDAAMQEGIDYICDLTESELFKKIYEGKLPAIMYLLSRRHPKYKDRIEVDATVTHHNAMTEEQIALSKEALKRMKPGQQVKVESQTPVNQHA